MKTIGAIEAESHFAQLLARAEQGEEIVVTRRSKPIVRISPFKVASDSAGAHQAMEEMRSRANRMGLTVTFDDIRSWINEGRA